MIGGGLFGNFADMKIAELFYSIQGEGPWMGVPCVFIRFSGCHLRCAWCDTPYASWHPEGNELSLDDLLEQVQKWPQAAVVITGGEPFLFPILPELCQRLKSMGHAVAIETSGSLYQSVVCDLLVISPKMASSDPDPVRYPSEYSRHRKGRENLVPLAQLLKEHPTSVLKCVVGGPTDFTDAQELAQSMALPPSRLWFMPLGTTSLQLDQIGTQVAQWALDLGARYSDRLHVRLWGNAKGK